MANVLEFGRLAPMVACAALLLGACRFDSSGAGESNAADETTRSEPTSSSTDGGDPASSTSAADGDEVTDGNPGSTTSTTSGTTTGIEPTEPLDDTALVVRYYLDEAARGQAPGAVLDAADDPLDLAHDWHRAVAYVVDADEHHGLQWEEPGLDGGPFAAIAGTKVREALEGTTQSTIEVVADMQEGMGSFSSRVLVIGQGTADARLGLFVSRDPQRPYFRWRGSTDAAVWDVDFQAVGRAVFHVVLETTAESEDRLRLYVNGIRAPVANDESWPEHGESIDFTDESVLVLGNRAPGFGERSFKGILYYGALYSVAFDERRIQTHVEVLLGSDDTPDE